jgi:hypothetical protein
VVLLAQGATPVWCALRWHAITCVLRPGLVAGLLQLLLPEDLPGLHVRVLACRADTSASLRSLLLAMCPLLLACCCMASLVLLRASLALPWLHACLGASVGQGSVCECLRMPPEQIVQKAFEGADVWHCGHCMLCGRAVADCLPVPPLYVSIDSGVTGACLCCVSCCVRTFLFPVAPRACAALAACCWRGIVSEQHVAAVFRCWTVQAS